MELIWIVVLLAVTGALWIFRDRIRRRAIPGQLRPGKPLPDFQAADEKGDPVRSTELRGRPSVLLFVRGTWCPFCSRQVRELAKVYKQINASGARLILVTPKPLETTRRVAEFFDVDFEFWLDESLHIARELGLLLEAGVPGDYASEYGNDTVWPTALVVDAGGTIRHTELSRFIADRPDPEKLLRIVHNL